MVARISSTAAKLAEALANARTKREREILWKYLRYAIDGKLPEQKRLINCAKRRRAA